MQTESTHQAASTLERILRTLAAWSFAFSFWGTLIPLILLSFRTLSSRFIRGAIRFWGRTTLRILKVDVTVIGEQSQLDIPAARVIVCNHQSALDILWGAVICPPDPLVIGKREVLWIPVLNAIWWALRFIRIDRKNRTKAIDSLRGVAERIQRERRSLVVAAEGTRTPNGEILPFKKGPFHIAIEGALPIVPIVVDGAFNAWPKTALIPRPGSVVVSVLSPISTQGVDRQGLDRLVADCEAKIKAELQRIRSR